MGIKNKKEKSLNRLYINDNSKYLDVLVTVFAILTILVIMWSALITLFPLCNIYGDSMLPNLNSGDSVIIYKSGDYDYDDIVVFEIKSENKILIKRVIAKSGDCIRFEIEGEKVIVKIRRNEGELSVLSEDYILEDMLFGDAFGGGFPFYTDIEISEGQFFVMGDNRNNSRDSRLIGAISFESILGESVARFEKDSFMQGVVNFVYNSAKSSSAYA